MNSRILTKSIYITVALGALLFGALFLRTHPKEEGGAYILAGDMRIPVSIADTDETRQEGLSGTPSLLAGTGKLFIFDSPGTYAFWMKDMQYPIDIVWIDESWKIVDISRALSPESYPTTFYTQQPIKYVLEINAYEANGDNFAIGSQLKLEK